VDALGAQAGAVYALGDHRGLRGWAVHEPHNADAALLRGSRRRRSANFLELRLGDVCVMSLVEPGGVPVRLTPSTGRGVLQRGSCDGGRVMPKSPGAEPGVLVFARDVLVV
jgi:hypothetical protein